MVKVKADKRTLLPLPRKFAASTSQARTAYSGGSKFQIFILFMQLVFVL